MKGYKTTKEKGHRQILFTLLPELVPGAAGSQRILADAHAKRNLIEYESFVEVTGGFIDEMVNAIKSVAEEVEFEFEKFKAANAPPAPPPPASKPKAGSKRR